MNGEPSKKKWSNTFIRTDQKEGADRMIHILNNSLEGLQKNPSESGTKMQQYTDLLSLFFINDFQWRPERNKGLHNKTSRFVPGFTTIAAGLSALPGLAQHCKYVLRELRGCLPLCSSCICRGSNRILILVFHGQFHGQ
jgi:hypothetical protein